MSPRLSSGPNAPGGLVVVGNGMAGSRFVSELRERDPAVPITVFGAEASQPYNRVLLSNVLAGLAKPGHIGLVDPEWYARHAVTVKSGVEVTRVDRDAKIVYADDGSATPYDTLVLATGSTALVPPMLCRPDGTLPYGAIPFRTLDDCRDIMAAAEGAHQAVVVGGGLLGIEAARGLAGRGLSVTVVHLAGHLMERQLDSEAGKVLARTLGRLGIRTRLEASVTGLCAEGDPVARVTGVELAGGEVLPADVVVVACGVRPEVSLGRAAGLAVDRGIVVDERLTSVSDPAIRAIGECAQHDGTVYGLVAPAWEQARILADLLTSTDPGARYTGSNLVTRLKAASIELAAMGETDPDPEADDVEVMQFSDAARGTYKKVVIRGDRVVGAILLGETSTAGLLTQLYDRAAPLPGDRLSLLFAGVSAASPADSPVRMPDAATVCHCNNVTKGKIRACWEQGARSADEVAARTRASTGCGSCRSALEGLVDWLGEQEPVSA